METSADTTLVTGGAGFNIENAAPLIAWSIHCRRAYNAIFNVGAMAEWTRTHGRRTSSCSDDIEISRNLAPAWLE
jgi:hypothetical protein